MPWDQVLPSKIPMHKQPVVAAAVSILIKITKNS
jgi:hypothetical protein